ncbi:MAG: aldose epimerase family protein [Spirochaetota bacterium]
MPAFIKSLPFGILSDGSEPKLHLLDNGTMRVAISDYGAIITSVLVPSGRAEAVDVVLGASALAGYAARHPYFGATIGRFANRIADGRFSLDGKEYRLAANNGKNHLHGGLKGFDRRMWTSEVYTEKGAACARMRLRSMDGNEGYPGTLDVIATFMLDQDNRLGICYEASTDAATPVNLTNHSYFNLQGEGNCSILDHELEISASQYLAVNEGLIPDGAPLTVTATPFDFRKSKPIGRDIAKAGGYDHCFVIDGTNLRTAAKAKDPQSGRTLELRTTMPGVQFYSGNFLAGFPGKHGSVYEKHAGFCLEAEYFPDSPNRQDFPSCILKPGQEYRHLIDYIFGF